MKTKLLAGALCACVVCAGSAFGFGAVSLANASQRAHAHSAKGDDHARPSLSRRLTKSFRLLARAASTSQSAAPSLPHTISPAAVKFYGLAVGSAQYVNTGSAAIWIVPGSSGACIMTQYSAASGPLAGNQIFTHCESTQSVLSDGLNDGVEWVTAQSQGAITVSLVPNGNQSMTATDADGNTVTVPVVGDIAVTRSPVAGPLSLAYKNANGSAMTSVQHYLTASQFQQRAANSPSTGAGA